MVGLRSFLITSDNVERFPACWAVTPLDEDDALELLRAVYPPPDGLLPQMLVVEELSPKEIHGRIGNFDYGVPVVRGVWYPHLDNP